MRISDNLSLLEIRKDSEEINLLMKKGIFKDEDTGLEYFTGYSYRTLYDWDQYFEAIVQIYMGWPSDLIKNGVMIFLEHQKESGLISRSVPSNPYHDPEHIKPFLSQISLLVIREYGESEWITGERYLSRLKKYIDFWLNDMDADKNGLSEWMSAPHTGMDNQHERAGYWNDRFCEGVDLNSYLVRELNAFSKIAKIAGKHGLAAEYELKSEALKERIRDILWDEEDGIFYDRNARTGEKLKSRHAGMYSVINRDNGEKLKVKSISSFAPLFARTATKEQAKRLVFSHLMNPEEFWTPYPVSTLAKSERWYSRDMLLTDMGCNWRACVWIPTNYMLYHGLKYYGYHDIASLLADKTHKLVKKAGNREWYDSESGEGNGLGPFWGWSLLGYFMPFEDESGFDITEIS